MIQAIGLMIAFYIITRMVHLLTDKPKEVKTLTLIFAVITILVAILGIYSLITSGSEISRTLLDF